MPLKYHYLGIRFVLDGGDGVRKISEEKIARLSLKKRISGEGVWGEFEVKLRLEPRLQRLETMP